MHYYQFNIGDYFSHTNHLDDTEDLAYRRMMDYCYLNEIGLPKAVEEIGRLIRMRTHCDCIANVLREFFILDGDVYFNKRIEIEIQNYKNKSTKAKASADVRWAKIKGSTDANALRTECEGNANHKPRTKNQEPLTIKHKPRTTNQEPRTGRQEPTTPKGGASAANAVFDYWKVVNNKAARKINPTVKGKIISRLKNFTIEQIKQAIDGNFNSPYHQGQNDQNRKYISLELICRNDEKLQDFMDRQSHTTTRDAELNAWLNDDGEEKQENTERQGQTFDHDEGDKHE